VHLDLGDLDAADAVVGHVGRDGRLGLTFRGVHTQFGAGFLPGPAVVVGLVDYLAALHGEVVLLRAELCRDLVEEIVAGCERGVVAQGRRAGAGGAAAGTGTRTERTFADPNGDVLDLQTERLSSRDRQHRSFAGAEILRRRLDQYAAVAVDGD